MMSEERCQAGMTGSSSSVDDLPLPDFIEPTASLPDLFHCFLCVDSFRSAKLLECKHMFCEQCLQSYYRTFGGVHYEQMGVFITCPTCGKLTKVPPNGFTGLDVNRDKEKLAQLDRKQSAVNLGVPQHCDICVYKNKLADSECYCSVCALNLCQVCQASHAKQQLFRDHNIIHISNKEILNLYCEQHNKRPIIHFCMDCNVAICPVCVLHEHLDHNTMKLRNALQIRRDNIKTQLNSLGPLLDKTESRLKRLSYLKAMQTRGNQLQRSTSECNTAVMETLPADKRKLSAVDQTSPDYESDREIQMMYFHLERLRKLYDLAAKTLEMSQSKKLLTIYKELVTRLQSMGDVEVKQIHKRVSAMLEQKESILNEMIQNMNVNSANSPTDQSSSTDDTSSIDEGIDFEVSNTSLLIRPKLIWKVEKHRNDTAELWNPCDITFMDGSVVVAEYDIMNDRNNRLRIFDHTGKTSAVIAQGQIRPLGLTSTLHGNIAITDCKSKRVKVYTPTGQLMSEWGKGQFGWPYGIAVNSKGQYIVTDAFNDSVSIHAPDGKRLKQFGSSGSGGTQFRNPYHVTVDSQDNILVSDCGNHCFKVFDSSGRFLFRNSETRSATSDSFFFDRKHRKTKIKLRAPRGITVDQKGNIMITDDNHRVCMYDSKGKFMRNILTEEDSVRFAEGLATDRGRLAVTEWNPNNMFAVGVFTLYE